jgi:hypothetical protein
MRRGGGGEGGGYIAAARAEEVWCGRSPEKRRRVWFISARGRPQSGQTIGGARERKRPTRQ